MVSLEARNKILDNILAPLSKLCNDFAVNVTRQLDAQRVQLCNALCHAIGISLTKSE